MTIASASEWGDVTPDGCSVELYDRMPSLGEAEMLHRRLPAGASALDLGCGTGRIARPLAGLGHPVVAVDESEAILSRIPVLDGVRLIQQRIQDLRLGEKFAAVVRASNMINTRDEALRQGMLATTCRDHVDQGGLVYVQWASAGVVPSWPEPRTVGRHHRDAAGRRHRLPPRQCRMRTDQPLARDQCASAEAWSSATS
jgi:SAM-dependent methyltransferase